MSGRSLGRGRASRYEVPDVLPKSFDVNKKNPRGVGVWVPINKREEVESLNEGLEVKLLLPIARILHMTRGKVVWVAELSAAGGGFEENPLEIVEWGNDGKSPVIRYNHPNGLMVKGINLHGNDCLVRISRAVKGYLDRMNKQNDDLPPSGESVETGKLVGNNDAGPEDSNEVAAGGVTFQQFETRVNKYPYWFKIIVPEAILNLLYNKLQNAGVEVRKNRSGTDLVFENGANLPLELIMYHLQDYFRNGTLTLESIQEG